MAQRDSEQIIRKYLNDDRDRLEKSYPESRLDVRGNERVEPRGREVRRKPYVKWASSPPRFPAAERCAQCGHFNIQSFAALYGRGTSTAVTLKGFIFKHGYVKSWRQTEQARICRPPRKKSFIVAVALLLLAIGGAACGVFVDGIDSLLGSKVSMMFFLLGVFGLYLAGYNLFWNLKYHPLFMREYGRLRFCAKCGTVTRI